MFLTQNVSFIKRNEKWKIKPSDKKKEKKKQSSVLSQHRFSTNHFLTVKHLAIVPLNMLKLHGEAIRKKTHGTVERFTIKNTQSMKGNRAWRRRRREKGRENKS